MSMFFKTFIFVGLIFSLVGCNKQLENYVRNARPDAEPAPPVIAPPEVFEPQLKISHGAVNSVGSGVGLRARTTLSFREAKGSQVGAKLSVQQTLVE